MGCAGQYSENGQDSRTDSTELMVDFDTSQMSRKSKQSKFRLVMNFTIASFGLKLFDSKEPMGMH